MNRFLFAGLAALSFLLVRPIEGDAQVVVACPTCASIVEQLVSDAKQAQQYLTQVASLQTELNQYANMIRNTIQLPQMIYANVTSDINQVRYLANAANLLTGNAGSIITRLNLAGSYANQAISMPANIGNQFQMWQTTLGNASSALGRTLGLQQGQEQNYAALQTAIQAHGQTAAGQMQAIQASIEMAGLTSQQLNQIQTTLTAAAQAQATRDAVEAERTAIADAYTTQFFSQPDAPLTGYPRY